MTDLEAVLDELSDGFCITDDRGRVLYLNPAARRILAVEDNDAGRINLCQDLCGHLVDQSGAACAEHCPLRGPGADGQAVTFHGRFGPRTVFEWREPHITRHDVWRNLRVRCLGVSLPSADSPAAENYVTLIEDATAEQDLRRHREDWRSMIAHDLRIPLTNIHSALQVLQEVPTQKPLMPGDRELIEISARSCRRMMELLDLYLDVAKLDSGTMPVRPENFQLLEFLQKCAAEQAALASSRGIEVAVSVPPDLRVDADSELLYRILQNLLNNALKYTPKGGRVAVSAVAAAEGGVEIKVKDTGSGISSEDLPYIFDRFYQARARREGRIQGNGLGLTFCREAAKAMGGSIRVKSEPGSGSEFVVALPPKAGGVEAAP